MKEDFEVIEITRDSMTIKADRQSGVIRALQKVHAVLEFFRIYFQASVCLKGLYRKV